MAIAFKRPFGPDTQELRDSVDLSDKEDEEIACGQCDAVYVLIYPRSSTPEQRARYAGEVKRNMANCSHHPPFINMTF